MITEFKQRNLLAIRPAHVPTDSIIFNAPRPLYASEGSETSWQGDFCSGIFYVVVHAEDPYRADWIKKNKSLDARVLAYVSEETARQMVREYYLGHGYEVTQEQLDEYWKDVFYQHFGEISVNIES
jgi:hypothetical protein